MNKKIIAILLVFTLVITCFVACQKEKLETTKINGEEVALATDNEGNTIVNNDNQIAVLVTDFDGNIIEHENGEPQTRWVGAGDSFIGDGYVMGDKFKLTLLEGWSGDIIGRAVKDDTDLKCYIQFVKNKELSKEVTLETYLEAIDEQNEELIEGFEKKGLTLTVDKNNTTIKNYNSEHYVYKIVDKDGKVIHYAENYYFIAEETIYSINYICVDGVGYDEAFSFANYISQNFTFKEDKK